MSKDGLLKKISLNPNGYSKSLSAMESFDILNRYLKQLILTNSPERFVFDLSGRHLELNGENYVRGLAEDYLVSAFPDRRLGHNEILLSEIEDTFYQLAIKFMNWHSDDSKTLQNAIERLKNSIQSKRTIDSRNKKTISRILTRLGLKTKFDLNDLITNKTELTKILKIYDETYANDTGSPAKKDHLKKIKDIPSIELKWLFNELKMIFQMHGLKGKINQHISGLCNNVFLLLEDSANPLTPECIKELTRK